MVGSGPFAPIGKVKRKIVLPVPPSCYNCFYTTEENRFYAKFRMARPNGPRPHSKARSPASRRRNLSALPAWYSASASNRLQQKRFNRRPQSTNRSAPRAGQTPEFKPPDNSKHTSPPSGGYEDASPQADKYQQRREPMTDPSVGAIIHRLQRENQEMTTQLGVLRKQQQESLKALAAQKAFISGLLGDIHADLLSAAKLLQQQIKRPPGR